MKIGTILKSGGIGSAKWWALDSLNEDTEFVTLIRLRWSPNLKEEPGVMFRTDEKIRFKNKAHNGTYLHSFKLGSFHPTKEAITLKDPTQ